jgi:hypothetical protein
LGGKQKNKTKARDMNSKQTIVITLAMVSVALLLAGCCCPGKPDSHYNRGIPQIIAQPENTETHTNGTATLTVKIKNEAADSDDAYHFTWFRKVAIPCGSDGFNFPGFAEFAVPKPSQFLTNGPDWISSSLTIDPATTNDDGSIYFCRITHALDCYPPEIIQADTRPALLTVFMAPNNKRGGGLPFTVGGTMQVSASYPPIITGTINTNTCGLSSYNGWISVKADNQNNMFNSRTYTTCNVSVDQLDAAGVHTHLPTSAFTVRAYPVPPATVKCADVLVGQNTRQFAPQNTTIYQFAVYLANANGYRYQLTVDFNP